MCACVYVKKDLSMEVAHLSHMCRHVHRVNTDLTWDTCVASSKKRFISSSPYATFIAEPLVGCERERDRERERDQKTDDNMPDWQIDRMSRSLAKTRKPLTQILRATWDISEAQTQEESHTRAHGVTHTHATGRREASTRCRLQDNRYLQVQKCF